MKDIDPKTLATEDEPVAFVYKTYDYGKFKYLLGNRTVKPSRISRITNSIKTVGYIEPSPIIVNSKFEVIDGQGRIEACKNNGLPIFYVFAESAGIEECRAMNIGQSNWGLYDYVQCEALTGNQNYLRLLRLLESFNKYTVCELYGICNGQIISGGGNASKIKNGDFYLSEERYKEVLQILNDLQSISKEIDGIPGSSRIKRTAIAWTLSNTGCDKKRLLNKIRTDYPLIRPVVDTIPVLFLSDLSDIYNKRLSKEKCLYFDAIFKNSTK